MLANQAGRGWHEGLQRGWLEAGNGFGWLAGFTLACLLYSVVWMNRSKHYKRQGFLERF